MNAAPQELLKEYVKREASVESVGGSAVRESGMKIGAGEHNHSEKVIHVAKAKSGTDDEFDLPDY